MIPDAVVEGGERFGRIGAGPQIDEAVLATLMTEVRYGPLEALWQSGYVERITSERTKRQSDEAASNLGSSSYT